MRRLGWLLFGVFVLACAVAGLGVAVLLREGLCGLLSLVLVFGSYKIFRAALGYEATPFCAPPPRREIDRLPRVRVRDAGGRKRVKIVGRVRILGKKLVAPLSERPCTFFEARVENQAAALVARETGGQDFVVEDESGRALVRLDSARVVVKLDASYQPAVPTSRQEALLRRQGKRPSDKLRYREGTLTPGEWVAVIGTPYLEPDPDPRSGVPFREMPMRLVFAGGDLYVTDDL